MRWNIADFLWKFLLSGEKEKGALKGGESYLAFFFFFALFFFLLNTVNMRGVYPHMAQKQNLLQKL